MTLSWASRYRRKVDRLQTGMRAEVYSPGKATSGSCRDINLTRLERKDKALILRAAGDRLDETIDGAFPSNLHLLAQSSSAQPDNQNQYKVKNDTYSTPSRPQNERPR
jgi:hypothetical protein